MIDNAIETDSNPDSAIGAFAPIENKALQNLLQLITQVIPVSQIFVCGNLYDEKIRLVVVLDKYRYQPAQSTKDTLAFVALGQPHIEIICYAFGTMNDHLKRGHYFFSRICVPANCIFNYGIETQLPDTPASRLVDLHLHARKQLASGLQRINDFLQTADLLIGRNKLNVAAFMLHQSCEQIYRLIILIFKGAEYKSHQLVLLQGSAAFYFPAIEHIFHDKSKKESNYLEQLQRAYIGARYQDDYQIDIEFLRETYIKLRICLESKLVGLVN